MRRVGRLAVSLLSVCACISAHTNASTETGNPPVIDAGQISLVVGTDEVQIVGAPGAVTPGGTEVELSILGTDETARVQSEPDGSFAVTIDATPDSVVEVTAVSGEMPSSPVYVTRGGATVGSGKGDELTCIERSNLASQVVDRLRMAADTSCNTASDCQLVETQTKCTTNCGGVVVAAGAVAGIDASIDTINQGLCASFAADGCKPSTPACTPPAAGSVPACVGGKCVLQWSECPSCLGSVVEWGTAMRISHSISDCDHYKYMPLSGTGCDRKVPHCDPSDSSATLKDLQAALAHPDVRQALAENTVFGLPNPGGLAPKISVGDASFVIFGCGNNASCTIPAGVTRLKELLDRIASEAGCQ